MHCLNRYVFALCKSQKQPWPNKDKTAPVLSLAGGQCFDPVLNQGLYELCAVRHWCRNEF